MNLGGACSIHDDKMLKRSDRPADAAHAAGATDQVFFCSKVGEGGIWYV